jgi:D-alanyl-D-alanine carboxypeptidase
MKQKIFVFLLILCAAPAFAEYKTKAKSVFLMDYDSGAEIVSKSADELMPPSSMLKLMTYSKSSLIIYMIWQKMANSFYTITFKYII